MCQYLFEIKQVKILAAIAVNALVINENVISILQVIMLSNVKCGLNTLSVLKKQSMEDSSIAQDWLLWLWGHIQI